MKKINSLPKGLSALEHCTKIFNMDKSPTWPEITKYVEGQVPEDFRLRAMLVVKHLYNNADELNQAINLACERISFSSRADDLLKSCADRIFLQFISGADKDCEDSLNLMLRLIKRYPEVNCLTRSVGRFISRVIRPSTPKEGEKMEAPMKISELEKEVKTVSKELRQALDTAWQLASDQQKIEQAKNMKWLADLNALRKELSVLAADFAAYKASIIPVSAPAEPAPAAIAPAAIASAPAEPAPAAIVPAVPAPTPASTSNSTIAPIELKKRKTQADYEREEYEAVYDKLYASYFSDRFDPIGALQCLQISTDIDLTKFEPIAVIKFCREEPKADMTQVFRLIYWIKSHIYTVKKGLEVASASGLVGNLACLLKAYATKNHTVALAQAQILRSQPDPALQDIGLELMGW